LPWCKVPSITSSTLRANHAGERCALKQPGTAPNAHGTALWYAVARFHYVTLLATAVTVATAKTELMLHCR